jgi:hypothetical protein
MSEAPVASDPNGLGASRVLRKENGYTYDAAYLLAIADRGDSLLFRGDAEWLEYMRLGGVEEDER